MGIEIGKILFDGPHQITSWSPPYRAGIYVIMMPADKPNTYTIIYVGESSNLSERGFVKQHHKYSCFIQQAGSEAALYIGIHLMSHSTQAERQQIESSLITQYRPICNN